MPGPERDRDEHADQREQQSDDELKNEPLFWRIINAAFGQRRKQLGNTLRAVQTDKDAPRARIVAFDINNKDKKWREIVPQAAETMGGVGFVRQALPA